MEPEIWPYYRGYYKVYTEDYEAKKKLTSWRGCRHSCSYFDLNGTLFGWDFIFPSRLYNKVAKAVGLPKRKKNPALIESGKNAAGRNLKHKFKG